MTIQEKIKEFASQFELMPGVTVIHDMNGFKPVYMSSNGLNLLGLAMEELIAVKEDYQKIFFNRDFMDDYLEQLISLIDREGVHETFTFFHQVKIEQKFRWYSASIKVFHVDDDSNPTHTITYAIPLRDFDRAISRADRLLKETAFAKKNLKRFSSLSPREKEVLALAATGKRPGEMAEFLNISIETINSHLKAVKSKLKSRTQFELTEYALAYDIL